MQSLTGKGNGWIKKLVVILIFAMVANVAMYEGLWLSRSGPERFKAYAASGDVILLWDTANGAVPGGWTSISSNPGDAFYGVFPRAAATYGAATAGADTHTDHTLAYSSATGAATLGQGAAGTATAAQTHTHTWGNPTAGSGDIRPPFKNLIFIKASSPTQIPANAIVVLDGALPAGFTSYAALNGIYLRGAGDNLTGGAATHTHTTTAVTSGSAPATLTDSGAGGQAAVAHTHTLAASSLPTAATNAPPYVDVIFAYNSSGAAIDIPAGAIAFFDAAPPANWNTVSNAAPWTGNFLRGSATFGATGGSSATHNHGGSAALTSGAPSATVNGGTTGGTATASNVHTHDVTYTVGASASTLPVYRDVILAKYAPSAPGATLMHNSTTTSSTKWAPNGWGIATGKYGEFTCETCHVKSTTNIKRIKTTITTPDASNFAGRATNSVGVNFQSTTTPNGFGDDATNSPRASSSKICEVCHNYDNTQATGVNAHPYSVGSPLTNHKGADNTDCTVCHKHNKGFAASCEDCHGYPPTVSTPGVPDGLADNNGGTPGGTTGSTIAGAHGAHVTTGNIACTACHYGSTGQGATHNNGDLKVTMGFYPFSTAQGGAYNGQASVVYDATTTVPATTTSSGGGKTCSTVYCHGNFTGGLSATPAWDGTAACGTCHANDAASASSLNANHPRHAGSGADQLSLACTTCHPGRSSWDGHVDASVQWDLDRTNAMLGSSATYNALELGSTGSKAPSGSYSACNNIYCHSIVQTTSGGALTANTADYKQPTWGGAVLTCTSCHGNPSSSGAHVTHTAGSPGNYSFACTDCHSGQIPPASSVHVNGSVNTSIATTWGTATYNGTAAPGDGFSDCSNTYCHSYGIGGTSQGGETRTVQANTSVSWGSNTACYSCHGDGVSSSRPAYPNNNAGYQNKKNSHQETKHSSLSCDKCHYNTTKDGTTIADADRANHVNRTYNVNGTGSTPYTFTYTYNVSGGSCATSYCHGTAAIAWGTTGSLSCNSCHQSQGGDNSTLATRFAPKHEKHTSTNYYTYSCEMCHALGNATNGNVSHTGGPATGGSNPGGDVAGASQTGEIRFRDTGLTWATGAYNGSAVNTYRYRTLYTNPFTAAAAIPTYVDGTASGTDTVNGSITYTTTGSSCGTVWCHSNANPVLRGAEANRNSYKAIAWNAATACTTCHRGPDTYTNMTTALTDQLSTVHALHAATDKYNFTCDECHADTIANNTTDTLNATTGYANHVDGTKSWKFSTTLRSTSVSQANGTYSGGVCANTYCHSQGTVLSGGTYNQATNTPVTSPTWTLTTLACNGCHTGGTTTGPTYTSGTPKANSHNAHVVTKGYACVACHSSTVDAANAITTPANHVNASYDVTGAKVTLYTYVSDGGTCTSTCHASSTPKWGTTSTGCSFCHSNLPTTGAHAKHVVTAATAYGSTAVSSTAPSYDFGCGNCHPKNEATYHMNGSVDIVLNDGVVGDTLKVKNSGTAARTGTGTTSVCNGVYCHSNGMASTTYTATPQWGALFSDPIVSGGLNKDACRSCHGNYPNDTGEAAGSAAHTAHAVGIHYDNIYTGTTGLATTGIGNTNSHGSATYSTTINCNICHNGTVTKARNKMSSKCTGCHSGDAAANAITSADLTKTTHVNGQPDVALANLAGTLRSKAQLRGSTAPTGWTRNTGYKVAGANDSATLAPTDYVGDNCTTACHLGQAVTWSSTVTCSSCHTTLP